MQNQHSLTFPDLQPEGSSVNAREHVEKGTKLYVFLGFVLLLLGLLIGTLMTYGILLFVLLLAPIMDYFNRKKIMALLKGSSVEIGPTQLPELYRCATVYAQRLGLETTPEVYIVEGNVINAAASKIGGRKVIILIDDAVDACLRSGDPRTLAFILAHEMAHHALGHTGLIRLSITQMLKKLSRLDEFSCDAVAARLVNDNTVSARALVTLLTGPQILPYVNLNALQEQAQALALDKNAVKAERPLTHPLLLRRLQRML